MLAAPARRRLETALEEARDRGALGPGPVGPHVDHALTMTGLLGGQPPSFLDLGSGAGVPGLVLALVWPEADGVLLDAQERRCRLLHQAIATLGLSRCSVVRGRAEEVARQPEHRERYSLVVARAFGLPAATAECGAPLLVVGGRLAVSEPPEPASARWPADGLARLGLRPAELRRAGTVAVAVMEKVAPTDDAWPRRTGIPSKRPLWT